MSLGFHFSILSCVYQVALAASKNLRPSGLELGGKSALIVFEDAEVEKAVEWAMVRALYLKCLTLGLSVWYTT